MELQEQKQGSASAQATESKDNEKTKTERRTFLKGAGITTGALCTLGLPKLAAAKTKELEEPDKSLSKEIELLEPEEKAALVTLLRGLWEIDWMLTPSIVQCYLISMRESDELREMKAKEEKAKKEERKHRDSLIGQAKVDYLVTQLTEDFCYYAPPFQREVMELVTKGIASPLDWKSTNDDKIYLTGKINKTFEGCSKSLCKKVIAQYLKDVLPAHEARYNQEAEELQACDELLTLTEGKTPQQIRDMTSLLKSSI